MSFASTTTANRQTLRDKLVNATKLVERVQEGGLSNVSTMGSSVDAVLAPVMAAVSAVGVASGTTAAVTTAGSVTVPITFTTARTAGATATVAATFTVANGVITAITIA